MIYLGLLIIIMFFNYLCIFSVHHPCSYPCIRPSRYYWSTSRCSQLLSRLCSFSLFYTSYYIIRGSCTDYCLFSWCSHCLFCSTWLLCSSCLLSSSRLLLSSCLFCSSSLQCPSNILVDFNLNLIFLG